MTQDIRICFVGDSFVNGTGDETTLGWTGRLCARAGRCTAITCYNLGIRRDTSADVRQRWERECALRLPAGCDGRLVVSFGVNDAMIEDGRRRVDLEASRENLRAILQRAKRYTRLVVGPPPVGEGAHDARIAALSEAYADDAQALDVPYIDLFSPLSMDHAYLEEVAANDGAHPRSGGYARMAGIIASSPLWWFRPV